MRKEWKTTGNGLQIYEGSKHVATAHYAGNPTVDFDDAVSNSRLIAAAPELLDALKALIAAMPEDICCGELVSPALDVAYAAIAKATGAA